MRRRLKDVDWCGKVIPVVLMTAVLLAVGLCVRLTMRTNRERDVRYVGPPPDEIEMAELVMSISEIESVNDVNEWLERQQ